MATGLGMTAVAFPLAALVGVVLFAAAWTILRRSSAVQEAGIVAMPAVAAATGATGVELVVLTAAVALVAVRLRLGRAGG